MSIRHYQAYKDSGVEWLGKIPEYWTLSRIKEKGSVRGRVGWKALKADEYVNEGYIFLSTPNIKEKNIDFENVNYITYERYIESPEIMLQEEDILLAKDGSTLGTVNIVTSLPREATVNSSIAVLRFKKQVFKKYLYYQILSEFIQNKISLKKSGMGVPHLFQRDINNFFILIPPVVEQKAIARYLDTKTAQIDRRIDLLTQKATLYSNLKQSLINETVTRGLDKSVPMKDSGIERIGEVPKHWRVYQFKRVAFYQEGPGLRNWQFKDDGIKVISVTNITPPTITFEKLEKYISLEEYEQSYKHFTVQKGDLLLASSGASWGKISIYDSDEKVILNTSTIRIHANRKTMASTHFIRWVLQSGYIYDSLITLLTGSCQPNFGPSHLSRLYVALPSLAEQQSIAEHLDAKTTQINRIIQTINTQIEKLKELRKTLINDVVTGKIKVV